LWQYPGVARLSATAIALVLLLFAGPASAGGSFEALMEQAVRAREAGDLPRALNFLEQAYGIEPSPGLLNNIGRVLEGLGRYGEASEAYRRVSADPQAEAGLRHQDDTRIAELAGKLDRAWLSLVLAPGVAARLDGQTLGRRATEELALDPGPHTLEARAEGSTTLNLFFLELRLGVRSTVRVDPGPPSVVSPSLDATLSLGDQPPRTVAVNGYFLEALNGVATIHLTPGQYRLDVGAGDGRTTRRAITLDAGNEIALSGLLGVEAGPRTPPSRLPWIIGGAAALGLAIGGGAAIGAAHGEWDNFRGSIDGTGTTTYTYPGALRVQSRANTEFGAGVALLIGAGVVGLGELGLWWLKGSEP
jgi:hypothetical protein